MKRFLLVAAGVLALAGPAAASEQHPTLAELENEIMCPVCDTTLAQSDSPLAQRMKQHIRAWIAAGNTKSEIKDKLVADFGPAILAAPPKKGFDLLAWVLPLVGILAGAALVGYLAWRWSRRRERQTVPVVGSRNGRPLEPELERRVDEELARFE